MALGPVMINGYLADSNSAKIKIDGKEYYGITKVSFGVTRESKSVAQVGTTASVGNTVGSGKATLSISMVYDYWVELKDALSLRGPFMQTAVDIIVSQSPISDGVSLGTGTRKETEHVFQMCTIADFKSDISAGGDAQMMDLTLDVRGVTVDGKAPYAGADIYGKKKN